MVSDMRCWRHTFRHTALLVSGVGTVGLSHLEFNYSTTTMGERVIEVGETVIIAKRPWRKARWSWPSSTMILLQTHPLCWYSAPSSLASFQQCSASQCTTVKDDAASRAIVGETATTWNKLRCQPTWLIFPTNAGIAMGTYLMEWRDSQEEPCPFKLIIIPIWFQRTYVWPDLPQPSSPSPNKLLDCSDLFFRPKILDGKLSSGERRKCGTKPFVLS